MSERIDHAAEARQLLTDYPGVVGSRPIDVAQVHATLALAEQQRIANMIALFNENIPESLLSSETWRAMEVQIKGALGI